TPSDSKMPGFSTAYGQHSTSRRGIPDVQTTRERTKTASRQEGRKDKHRKKASAMQDSDPTAPCAEQKETYTIAGGIAQPGLSGGGWTHDVEIVDRGKLLQTALASDAIEMAAAKQSQKQIFGSPGNIPVGAPYITRTGSGLLRLQDIKPLSSGG